MQTLGFIDSIEKYKSRFNSEKLDTLNIVPYKRITMSKPSTLQGVGQLFICVNNIPYIWRSMLNDIVLVKKIDSHKIAEYLHVSEKTVKRILLGQSAKPSLENRYRIFLLHTKLFSNIYRVELTRANGLILKISESMDLLDSQISKCSRVNSYA